MALSTKAWRGWLVLTAGLLPLIYLGWQIIRLQSGEWDVLGPEPGRAIVFFTAAGDQMASDSPSNGWATGILVRNVSPVGLCCFSAGMAVAGNCIRTGGAALPDTGYVCLVTFITVGSDVSQLLAATT